jgi:hypothetical protein
VIFLPTRIFTDVTHVTILQEDNQLPGESIQSMLRLNERVRLAVSNAINEKLV